MGCTNSRDETATTAAAAGENKAPATPSAARSKLTKIDISVLSPSVSVNHELPVEQSASSSVIAVGGSQPQSLFSSECLSHHGDSSFSDSDCSSPPIVLVSNNPLLPFAERSPNNNAKQSGSARCGRKGMDGIAPPICTGTTSATDFCLEDIEDGHQDDDASVDEELSRVVGINTHHNQEDDGKESILSSEEHGGSPIQQQGSLTAFTSPPPAVTLWSPLSLSQSEHTLTTSWNSCAATYQYAHHTNALPPAIAGNSGNSSPSFHPSQLRRYYCESSQQHRDCGSSQRRRHGHPAVPSAAEVLHHMVNVLEQEEDRCRCESSGGESTRHYPVLGAAQTDQC